MGRDAYSAGGQPQQADAAAQPLDLRTSTANLTQELSQLLAASIAQGQAGKRAAGTGAGSELANLAALVSASQNQRSQPAHRDGLSALSYTRPAQPPAPPPPPGPAPSLGPVPAMGPAPALTVPGPSSGLLVAEPHDEEPMPIPSTWRQPTVSDDDRWYRQQMGAAGLGLVAGLIVVVPAVLWLSGWLGGPQPKAAVARVQAVPEPPVQVAEVKPVKVHVAAAQAPSRVVASDPPARIADPEPPRTGSTRVAKVTPPPAAIAEPPPAAVAAGPQRAAEPVRSRVDELQAQARRLIDTGDIMAARTILQTAEAATSAPMTFMLAETFDPIMLAAWQTRGVAANPERARALYQRARDLGETRAQQRLDALMGN
jgi:hypothetical protein